MLLEYLGEEIRVQGVRDERLYVHLEVLLVHLALEHSFVDEVAVVALHLASHQLNYRLQMRLRADFDLDLRVQLLVLRVPLSP